MNINQVQSSPTLKEIDHNSMKMTKPEVITTGPSYSVDKDMTKIFRKKICPTNGQKTQF